MQRTKIEWCDYSWNPVKGLCPTACWYCYARAMYKRFKWNPELRLDLQECSQPILPRYAKKPLRIFAGSTIDLLHPTISDGWIHAILAMTYAVSQHTFIFLTKFPQRYADFDFPENCWLGVTVTKGCDMPQSSVFGQQNEKNLWFISFEPLLGEVTVPMWSEWNIIGTMTGHGAKKYQPNGLWIRKIVCECMKHKVPVFLKNNLTSIWGGSLIQEFPEAIGG